MWELGRSKAGRPRPFQAPLRRGRSSDQSIENGTAALPGEKTSELVVFGERTRKLLLWVD